MKICLVNNLSEPWERGGAEKVVGYLAAAARAAGHEVIIIATKPCFKSRPKTTAYRTYYLSSCYYNLGRWPKTARLIWHAWQLASPRRERRLKKILKKEKVDAVLTHNLLGVGFTLGRAAEQLGIKHLHWLHDIQLLHPAGLLLRGQEKKLDSFAAKTYTQIARQQLSNPAVVISPSAWLLNEHERRGWFSASHTIILPNPLETPLIKKQPLAGPLTFLFAGQVEEHKGIFLLMEAWKKFNIAYPDAKLLLAGAGSALERAKQLTGAGVEFLGKLPSDELYALMSRVDCLVVPSICYENSPSVIYEAAVCGLPVIASALGGVKELLAGDYLFAPQVDALADKLLWMSNRRNDLAPPPVKLIAPHDYWQKIKELL